MFPRTVNPTIALPDKQKKEFMVFLITSFGLTIVMSYFLRWMIKHLGTDNMNFAVDITKRKSFKISDVWAGSIPPQAQQILDIFNYSDVYDHFGKAVPKGILLYGMPGTGKTHFARIIAQLTGSEFFSASASQFDEIFVGKGAQRVRNLFDEAKRATQYSMTEKVKAIVTGEKLRPKRAVIFIDELDAIGTRNNVLGYNSSHSTVSQLLTCLDGLEERGNIFVIAATNNITQIDPAIRRSGRFDRVIEMPLPNMKSRKELLRFYLGNAPGITDLIEQKVISKLATKTEGFSAADIKNLSNESIMAAVEQTIRERKLNKETDFPSQIPPNYVLTEEHLENAFNDMTNKLKKEKPVTPSILKYDLN